MKVALEQPADSDDHCGHQRRSPLIVKRFSYQALLLVFKLVIVRPLRRTEGPTFIRPKSEKRRAVPHGVNRHLKSGRNPGSFWQDVCLNGGEYPGNLLRRVPVQVLEDRCE